MTLDLLPDTRIGRRIHGTRMYWHVYRGHVFEPMRFCGTRRLYICDCGTRWKRA